jgi:CBS domain-containing protein
MAPAPACCTKYAALTDVARMMRDRDCGAIPVVETNASSPKLVGIITDRDIVLRSLADNKDPFHLAAVDCMTTVVATVTPETSLEDCKRLMEEHQVRRVPVVDNKGVCCGIVAQADLARHAPAEETGQMVREVSQPTHERRP